MYRNFEKLHTDVYALLRSLGVKADHTQFFYTAYAIALVANQPLRGLFFTCMVLRPVAMFYDIPVTTVRDAIHCTAGEAADAGTFLFADIFSRRQSCPPRRSLSGSPVISTTNVLFDRLPHMIYVDTVHLSSLCIHPYGSSVMHA